MQNYGSLEYSGGLAGTPGSIPLTTLAPQAANTVVANNTGGAASPTAVPYASMPWVLKAGDTMTGSLFMAVASGLGYKVTQTAGGFTPTDAASVIQSDDAGVAGPAQVFYHNSVSPAVSDAISIFGRSYFNNSAAALTFGGQNLYRLMATGAGVESTQFEVTTRQVGVNATRLAVGAGAVIGTATGGDQGAGTLNATSLYENGTALSAKYVAKAGDTMTGPLVVNVGSALAPGAANITSRSDDPGSLGPWFTIYHNSASPAAADNLGGLVWYGKDSAAADVLYADHFVEAVSVTTSAVSARHRFLTRTAGVAAVVLNVGAGTYSNTATGGDQGAGTANFTDYFDDGVNITGIYGRLAVGNAWAAQNIFSFGGTTVFDRTGGGTIVNEYRTGGVLRGFVGCDATYGFIVYATGGTPTMSMANAGGMILGAPAGAALGQGTLNAAGVVRTGQYTFATLPAAGTVGAGAQAYITDGAAVPVFAAAAGGGGTTGTNVTSDGTIWRNG